MVLNFIFIQEANNNIILVAIAGEKGKKFIKTIVFSHFIDKSYTIQST